MDDVLFTMMRIAAFGAGIVGFVYVIFKKSNQGQAKETYFKLGACAVLILVGLLAGKITSFKAGPGGFEMGFEAVRGAAEEIVRANPEIAEELTGRQGEEAVAEAVKRIQNTRNKTELARVIPFELKDDAVVFKPRTIDRNIQPVRVPLETLRLEPRTLEPVRLEEGPRMLLERRIEEP